MDLQIIVIALLLVVLYLSISETAKVKNENHRLRATLANTLAPLRQINARERDRYLAVVINSADCVLKGIKDDQAQPVARPDRSRV